jgi:hypothetical protein
MLQPGTCFLILLALLGIWSIGMLATSRSYFQLPEILWGQHRRIIIENVNKPISSLVLYVDVNFLEEFCSGLLFQRSFFSIFCSGGFYVYIF